MADLGFAEAFAKYGAKLKNVNWSVCAESPDGSLVVSLWSHHFKKGMVYRDTTACWSGAGKNEFVKYLDAAYKTKQKVRLVIATTTHPELVESGADASKIPKTFTVREDLVGRVVEFDGERFAIEFEHVA